MVVDVSEREKVEKSLEKNQGQESAVAHSERVFRLASEILSFCCLLHKVEACAVPAQSAPVIAELD